MQHIVPLEFIDVSQMSSMLVMKYRVHFQDDRRRQAMAGSPHHDTETILLRGPEAMDDLDNQELAVSWFTDVAHEDRPLLTKWPSAQKVIGDIGASLHRRFGYAPQFGKIMVVSLKPGGFIDWHVDEGSYAAAHNRFHVCLEPSPGAWLYSGGEAQILPRGQLTFVNNRVLHSAANFGPVPRMHMIVDVRIPEKTS